MLDELEFKRWIQRVTESSGKKIKDSAHFMTLFTEGYEKEPQCALEFGIAILLDKPIYVLVPKGTRVPENVKRLARGVEYFDKEVKGDVERAAAKLLEGIKP